MTDHTEASNIGSESQSSVPETRKLRIWPAVALVIALWAIRIVPGMFEELPVAAMMLKFMGPAGCAMLILLWWVFFSRAALKEKLVGLFGVIIIGIVTATLADKSLRGFGTIIYAVPWGITAFAVSVVCVARMPTNRRISLALLVTLFAFGFWDTVRSDGVWGDFRAARSWRWEATAEARFLRHLASRSNVAGIPKDTLQQPLAESEWPAFRGPHRDAVQPGIVLEEDWNSKSPQEVWRIQVGPGWSSFSIAGRRLFTQEQRGENEVIVCYDAQQGTELWVHTYPSRFWESIGGAGPRATPTLSDGQLFALGADGLIHRLDPVTGNSVWQGDLKVDAERAPPTWGFASSPLVIDDAVIVHAGGPDDKGVLAYDRESGELKWSAPAGDHSYSSPQLAEVAGITCILMLSNQGLTFIEPSDGTTIGDYEWIYEGYRVVQPLQVDASSLLLGTGMGTGTRRINVRSDAGRLVAEEDWTSRHMKPDYNDFVAHKGHLYGFDHNIFACIDLETGTRKWKKGRYGNGQVLLLPDADQLLVISETGNIVLLRATPAKLEELARCSVLEGKTWNHPVLVGNRLYVRNGEQAACFEMPVKTP